MQSIPIVVMAKYPTPGRVKTRLAGLLSPEQCAGVHRIFLRHLVATLERRYPGNLLLCFDPPDAAPAFADLLKIGPSRLLPQAPGDLGVRLAAASFALTAHHERILFIGVDSPDLPAAHLDRAISLTRVHDVTLGPTEDGGYWCLGLRSGCDVRKLLEGIPWSSGTEAQATLDRASSLNLSTAKAPCWDDVDHPQDLQRLMLRLEESEDPAHDDLLTKLRAVLDGGQCV